MKEKYESPQDIADNEIHESMEKAKSNTRMEQTKDRLLSEVDKDFVEPSRFDEKLRKIVLASDFSLERERMAEIEKEILNRFKAVLKNAEKNTTGVKKQSEEFFEKYRELRTEFKKEIIKEFNTAAKKNIFSERASALKNILDYLDEKY